MARILGISWQHSHQTEHLRQGWAAVRGQERGQRSAMPQCLGPFRNPVLCCPSPITGRRRDRRARPSVCHAETPSRPRPGHPPVRSNLRSRLRRPGLGVCSTVSGVLPAPVQVVPGIPAAPSCPVVRSTICSTDCRCLASCPDAGGRATAQTTAAGMQPPVSPPLSLTSPARHRNRGHQQGHLEAERGCG